MPFDVRVCALLFVTSLPVSLVDFLEETLFRLFWSVWPHFLRLIGLWEKHKIGKSYIESILDEDNNAPSLKNFFYNKNTVLSRDLHFPSYKKYLSHIQKRLIPS